MAGGDVNEADYDGRTALHLAAGNSIDISVQIFWMSNQFVPFCACQITNPSSNFGIAHQSFADQKQKETVEFLLKAGAQRLPDRWGNLPD